MKKSEIKEKIVRAIEENAEKIIEIGEKILKNPEMGYKEQKTAALVCGELSKLGIEAETALAKTGVKGRLRGGKSELTLAIIGA